MADAEKLSQFVAVTGSTPAQAQFYLESSGGDVDAAVSSFLDSGAADEALGDSAMEDESLSDEAIEGAAFEAPDRRVHAGVGACEQERSISAAHVGKRAMRCSRSRQWVHGLRKWRTYGFCSCSAPRLC